MAGIGELEAQTLSTAIGRRALRAATALAAAGVVGLAALTGTADAEPRAASRAEQSRVLQPGAGRMRGTYLRATPQTGTWGGAQPEQRGGGGRRLRRPPDARRGLARGGPGGPGEGRRPEDRDPRSCAPCAVRRHLQPTRQGALPREYPERFEGIPEDKPFFNQGGNISVFTTVEQRRGHPRGVLPGRVPVSYPLAPFMGIMGIARDTSATVDSIPRPMPAAISTSTPSASAARSTCR